MVERGKYVRDGVLLQKCTKPPRVQETNVRSLEGKGDVYCN